MIQLAILACLAALPTECREVRLAAPAHLTPFQCIHRAMPQVARWAAHNPTYRVKRFRCVRHGRVAFPNLRRSI